MSPFSALPARPPLPSVRNWLPWVLNPPADPPSTDLGEQEWAYFEDRGVIHTPGLAG